MINMIGSCCLLLLKYHWAYQKVPILLPPIGVIGTQELLSFSEKREVKRKCYIYHSKAILIWYTDMNIALVLFVLFRTNTYVSLKFIVKYSTDYFLAAFAPVPLWLLAIRNFNHLCCSFCWRLILVGISLCKISTQMLCKIVSLLH